MMHAAFAFLLAASSPPGRREARDPDWPCFRGPGRDGVSLETDLNFDWPAGGPKVLWKKNVGTGYSSIAVAVGRAYARGNREGRDTVYCLDAETGIEVWKHSYDCPLLPRNYAGGPGATPFVDGERVYAFSKVGVIFSLEASTGKLVWRRDVSKDPGSKTPDWGFEGSPVVLGNRLYLNAGTAGLCLDKATGETIWTSDPAGQAGYSTPVFRSGAGPTVMAVMGEKAARGVDASEGRPLRHAHRGRRQAPDAAGGRPPGRRGCLPLWIQGDRPCEGPRGALLDDALPGKRAALLQERRGGRGLPGSQEVVHAACLEL